MNYKEQYIEYLDAHIANVKRAYKWLLEHHVDSKFDFGDEDLIEKNIKGHDKSKWSDEEFESYAQFFYGKKSAENTLTFNEAWNHHQKCNLHHWQYWVLIQDDPGEKMLPLEMPAEYIVEMVCDWWAFSFKTGNLQEIFEWYKKNKDAQIMHKTTRKNVEKLLAVIEETLAEPEEGK